MKQTKQKFYAVKKGRQPGIVTTWDECKALVDGFTGAAYKSFPTREEADAWLQGTPIAVADSSSTTKPNSSKGKKRAMSPVLDESEWDVVYSDGACKGNGQVGSVAGVGVWWGHDDPRNVAERCPGDQTNNRAELIAIVRVLETTPHSKKPLLIKTDSKYSIQCFEDWLPGWIRNGWRTSNNEPVKNVGVIKYLAALLDTRARRGQKVRLQYVKGHVGITGNEGADRQANLGAQDPPMKERDWAKLEVELRKCLENELRTADDKPDTVLPEVGSGEGTESPAKVRKITSTSKPTSSNSVVQPLKPSSRSAPQMSAVPVSPPPGVVHSPRSAAPPPTAADLDDYANCLLDDDDLAADLSD